MAESEAAKAIAADPSNADARRFHALTLDDLDRNEDALKEAQRAVELSPMDPATHLQLAMSAKRNEMERAILEARRAIELGPENSAAYKFLMSCLLEAHRNDEAIELAEAQVAQDFDPLDRVDLGVQVADADPHLEQVVGQVLRHLLRQRRD